MLSILVSEGIKRDSILIAGDGATKELDLHSSMLIDSFSLCFPHAYVKKLLSRSPRLHQLPHLPPPS
jgi:hypothetical protein